jgi:hypothetical protein
MCQTPPTFRACLDAGMTAAAGWFFTSPSSAPAKALNPVQSEHHPRAQPGAPKR